MGTSIAFAFLENVLTFPSLLDHPEGPLPSISLPLQDREVTLEGNTSASNNVWAVVKIWKRSREGGEGF